MKLTPNPIKYGRKKLKMGKRLKIIEGIIVIDSLCSLKMPDIIRKIGRIV